MIILIIERNIWEKIDKITFFVIFRGAINANPVIGLNNTRLI